MCALLITVSYSVLIGVAMKPSGSNNLFEEDDALDYISYEEIEKDS